MSKSVAIIGTRGFPSYYGGFETAVRELAPYLVERGWDVTVYGRKKSIRNDDPLSRSAVISKTTPGLDYKSLSTLTYGLTASLHARSKKPDVAPVMNVANGYFLPILRRAGIPTLVNVDGIEWEREKWGKRARQVFYKGAELTARYADQLVFDAQAIGDYWKKEFNRDGVYIPYGGRFRDELPVEPGLTHRGYVLVVARFVPENTIPEFLEAAPGIAEQSPVVIVGSSGYGGPLDEQAAQLASKHPNIHWFGHVANDDRLHALWQHAGAYFHGHSVGGTNPALVQAMSLGAPTVARDTIYNREVLAENGVFVGPDPADIVATVESFITDAALQNRLVEGAVARARNEYSWDLVTDRYEKALLGLFNELT